MKTLTPEPHSDLAEAARLRHLLEAAGWRYTRQRAAVYEFLRSAHSHPTAEEVYAAVRLQIPKISLATVYKALEALVDSQIVDKINSGDGPARYDCRHDPHYHLRCLESGEVRDLPTHFDAELLAKLDPDLVENLARQGFHVTGYRLEVLGHFSKPTPADC